MNKVATLFGAAAMALSVGGPAMAQSSCWSPAELQAYDITMQTLLLAHVAADCDQAVQVDPPLRARLAQFLGQHGQQMDSDRQALSQYFKRAYVDDWEAPMQNSLDREEKRVNAQVKQTASPDFCEGASKALESLSSESWEKYAGDAANANWHSKAGLPTCQ